MRERRRGAVSRDTYNDKEQRTKKTKKRERDI